VTSPSQIPPGNLPDLAKCRAAAVFVTGNSWPIMCRRGIAALVVESTADRFRPGCCGILPSGRAASRSDSPGGSGISGSATIDPSARLEPGCDVEANAVIAADAEIGTGTVIAAGAAVGPGAASAGIATSDMRRRFSMR
jgi:UDP-3-O-[3-hydroxymyristoyl] glucosamine N-acyltransferase